MKCTVSKYGADCYSFNMPIDALTLMTVQKKSNNRVRIQCRYFCVFTTQSRHSSQQLQSKITLAETSAWLAVATESLKNTYPIKTHKQILEIMQVPMQKRVRT